MPVCGGPSVRRRIINTCPYYFHVGLFTVDFGLRTAETQAMQRVVYVTKQKQKNAMFVRLACEIQVTRVPTSCHERRPVKRSLFTTRSFMKVKTGP